MDEPIPHLDPRWGEKDPEKFQEFFSEQLKKMQEAMAMVHRGVVTREQAMKAYLEDLD